MKNIYLIVGPSGSGKTTLVEEMEKRYGYKPVVSYTTRERRYPGETGHIFVSKEQFDALPPMVAYTLFDGNEYGATAHLVDISDTYVIDVAGVRYLKERYRGKKGVVTIGLMLPEIICAARMARRGDSDGKIEERIKNDRKAFGKMEDVCDFMVNAKCDRETLIGRVMEIVRGCEAVEIETLAD